MVLGKYCPHSVGKLRLVGACLSLWAVLAFFSFLPLTYYAQLAAYFPPAACTDSGAGQPDMVILAGDRRSSEDDVCTLWDVASELENLVLCEQPAPEDDYPALSFPFSDPLPVVSKFKRPALLPRAPPIPL